MISDPISAISLGVALIFGTAGLPHILMRFFTVPDAKSARISAFYATSLIGYFYILTFVIGFGAIIFLTNNSLYLDENGNLIGSNNMAAIHLSHVLGGEIFLGFISAVAFATILAVVSGLTLAGASAIGRDLYVYVINNGRQMRKKKFLYQSFICIHWDNCNCTWNNFSGTKRSFFSWTCICNCSKYELSYTF